MRYKDIWLSELKLHPELFSTVIVSFHDTRSNATYKELQVQKIFNVVKSDLFINKSYARGGFGDTTYSPEEKAATSKKLSASGILAHSNKSDIAKEITSKKISDAYVNKTDVEKATRSKKISDSHANRTPELKLDRITRTNATKNARTQEQRDATKAKMNATTEAKSPEQKAEIGKKISDTKKGVSPPIVECPHCKMSGSISNMKRWHFDKCKQY
jgi:hypothetical protein